MTDSYTVAMARSLARELIAESIRTRTVTTASHSNALEAELAKESASVYRPRASGELEFAGPQRTGIGYPRRPMWLVRLLP